MKYTERIEKAIQTASTLHRNQKRKSDKELPYVSHLFSVATILSEHTDDEDVIVAGFLHDAIEDTEYTKKELEKDFGKKVTEIVLDVSEDNIRDGKVRPWKDRKERYIKHLKVASEDALLVSTADKLHNLHSIINECEKVGNKFLEKLSTGPEEQIWFNESVLEVLKKRIDNKLVDKFEEEVIKFKELALK
ncbi:MAG: HD domain-containing protein [Candidatus Pacebacteria bacterium]|jgi:(p)ppGpp synthase/HD superfamily hydrolase|nr:guanosine polyphosphate pyrophosphohydrolase [bacterium]MDP6527774.1 HD domain-containing protein [Candidatus Paceibacterota bacterium]MDP6659611.1 HD domain-containing protein [Candidatus Paceibacterota bacterium]|tara:strand:- start:40743 stop:41315 length:573 start_codon:yes stop_codon:yes gene_type:complete